MNRNIYFILKDKEYSIHEIIKAISNNDERYLSDLDIKINDSIRFICLLTRIEKELRREFTDLKETLLYFGEFKITHQYMFVLSPICTKNYELFKLCGHYRITNEGSDYISIFSKLTTYIFKKIYLNYNFFFEYSKIYKEKNQAVYTCQLFVDDINKIFDTKFSQTIFEDFKAFEDSSNDNTILYGKICIKFDGKK